MNDQPDQPASASAATTTAAADGESPISVDSESDAFGERPELFVAGAFVGGVVLAQVLRRLGP